MTTSRKQSAPTKPRRPKIRGTERQRLAKAMGFTVDSEQYRHLIAQTYAIWQEGDTLESLTHRATELAECLSWDKPDAEIRESAHRATLAAKFVFKHAGTIPTYRQRNADTHRYVCEWLENRRSEAIAEREAAEQAAELELVAMASQYL